jgi:hypothetical protein
LQTAIVYLVIGSLGLATYVFTSVFVYMSEKDLEHHIATRRKNEGENQVTQSYTPTSTVNLPEIVKDIGGSVERTSFEQSRKDGIIEIDLEHQAGAGMESIRMAVPLEFSNRRKPRLILFN